MFWLDFGDCEDSETIFSDLSLCSVVNQFLQVLTEQLLENDENVPKGLMLHILDLYISELAQVGSAEVRRAEAHFILIHLMLFIIEIYPL